MSASPNQAAFQPIYPWIIRRLIQAAVLIALLVLIGWIFHIETLKRIAPGLTSMNPLSAITFVLSGAALWCLKDGPVGGRRDYLVILLGSVVLLIGLTRIADVSFGTSFCPDQVLFRSQLDFGQAFPSHVSPNAALCFCLFGAAVLVLDRMGWPDFLHPQWLVLPLMALAWAAIVGYAYNTSGFYQYRQFIPMSLHTAVCLLLLALALILSRPAQGFMRLIPRGSLGARSFRRLLPACVLVPLLLGACQLAAVAAGKLSPETGASLASVATTLVLAVLAYFTALSLNRIDVRRQRADAELLARTQQEQRAREWAQSLSELEDLIRASRDDLPSGGAALLRMLVGKTGALQGALYQAVSEAGGAQRLRTLALYAYDRAEQANASYALGEGLVGQCAVGRRPLMLDTPPGYFRLRSANLDVLPRHLLLLPVMLDEELLGVLELACAAPLVEEIERLLQSALRVIAYGVYRYGRAQQLAAELERLRAQVGLRA